MNKINFLLAVIFSGAVVSSATANEYSISFVKSDKQTIATDINNNGTVVGSVLVPAGDVPGCGATFTRGPFVYRNGQLKAIAAVDPWVECLSRQGLPIDINDAGVIVGESNRQAYRYQNGIFSNLQNRIQSDLKTPVNASTAIALNNGGKIVGAVNKSSGLDQHAILFNGSKWLNIAPGSIGVNWNSAVAVNDGGAAVVQLGSRYATHSFAIYKNGKLDLPKVLSDFFMNSSVPMRSAYDINNKGSFVGLDESNYYGSFTPLGAFLYNGSDIVKLGLLAGASKVVPTALNNNNKIVGYAVTGSADTDSVAVMRVNGAWLDLNSKISQPGVTLITAEDINDRGAIVGLAKVAGKYKGYILTTRAAVVQPIKVYLRGSFNGWGMLPMVNVDGVWEATVTVAAGAVFKFDVKGDWSENYGESTGDNVADLAGDNIPFGLGAGKYKVTFNYLTKVFSITKLP